ncbi:MAG: hypothetical protein JO353_11010 [Phycisphaerae bacterium]|nr:hypothetical protein [Phycisphaerae bacterium]
MVAIRGRFDGKVFVPDETVDLPRDQRVILHVETASPEVRGTPGCRLERLAGSLSKEEGEEMIGAIEDAFGQIDKDSW